MDKEEYVKRIKAIGQHIIDNAETFLCDYEINKIREITFYANVQPFELPTFEVNKSYFPNQIFNKGE